MAPDLSAKLLQKAPAKNKSKIARAKRARRYLSQGGVNRDDSDDELGVEDHPWEWIFSDSNKPSVPNTIIGAHMGNFRCMLGDCVLLKAEGSNEAWVGIITEFQENEEEGEKVANFMWFSTEKEIRNKQKKIYDVLPVRIVPRFIYAYRGLSCMQNELYITPSWDINPLASINGKATVMSLARYSAKYPSGKVPRSSRDHGKAFICRRGCNTRTTTYTDEFLWEDIYCGPEDLHTLTELVETETKATRKRKKYKEDGADHDAPVTSDDDDALLETPTKKQKLSMDPNSRIKSARRNSNKHTTPKHKRYVVCHSLYVRYLYRKGSSLKKISNSHRWAPVSSRLLICYHLHFRSHEHAYTFPLFPLLCPVARKLSNPSTHTSKLPFLTALDAASTYREPLGLVRQRQFVK